MYIILDKNLKRVATLDTTSDDDVFWGETIQSQLADDATSSDSITESGFASSTDPNANSKSWNDTLTGLTMLADSPAAQYLVVGNHIAVYDQFNDRWRVYRIYTVDENISTATGAHLVSVDAINLLIWRLGKTIPAKSENTECSLDQAIDWVISGTNITLVNNATSGLLTDFSISGTDTSQTVLQTILATYDCEADGYVTLDSSGLVSDIILELSDQRGQNTGQRITYGDNMLSIQRETVDTTLVTKLYVYGENDETIVSATGSNGEAFITDATANALYNSDANTWLEGTVTSSTITEPNALLALGLKTLRLYNHPRVNYTVDVTSDFDVQLGDTIKVIDLTMNPVLTLQARVIQRTTSESDPTQNKVVIGEFSTVTVVTPNFIQNLEQRFNDHVAQLFEDAKNNSTAASISLITPLGQSWANTDTSKRVIARLFIEGENVTSFLSASAFNWGYIQQDGTHNLSWESEHAKDGYEVTITPPFVGSLVVTIDDAYVKTESEMWINTGVNPDGAFKKLWETLDVANTDEFGNNHIGALQFSYQLSTGEILASYAYTGTKDASSISDCQFLKWDATGKLESSMIVQGGLHGASFGYDETNNVIYSQIQDLTTGDKYLCTFPFTAGAVISSTSSAVTKWCAMDSYVRPNVDLTNGLWLGSQTDGTVEVCNISDLKAGNYLPIIQFKLSDFGWNPVPSGVTNDGTYNTVQANSIAYPYAFFTAGDVNNKDDRLVLCVNLITQSVVFNYQMEPTQDVALAVPIDNGGHFEPEGIYPDLTNNQLIIGFNVSEYRDDAHTVMIGHSAIYSVPIGVRDDSQDLAVAYPAEDEGENDETETAVTVPDDSADDSDDASDDDDDFNIDTGEGYTEVIS
ncbi:phage tail spike protein [Secundilactobacillus collinoides]|uniref:Phage minor structural protein n=1 Tax=Secundilactobacillus collinoides TaxID=33960 RepID=A0A166GDI8_SECCO|nr:phage tail spike protein [Secundilactobacillus collinoides]KZL38734.1 phage minor structural protein [Secundilactobacillus collinoides]